MQTIDTDSWEEYNQGFSSKGKRSKKWLFNDGTVYLFKETRLHTKQEIWSEIFYYHLGTLVGLDVPRTRLASNGNHIGVLINNFLNMSSESRTQEEAVQHSVSLASAIDPRLSKNHYPIKKEEELQHGFDLLSSIDPRPYKEKHNIFLIKKVFIDNGILSQWRSFKRMLILDCLVGNTDRHNENWGICVNINNPNLKRLSPVFDNSTCFAPQENEEKIARLLANEDDFIRFINRCRPPIYWSCDGRSFDHLRHFDLIKQLTIQEPETIDLINELVNIPEPPIDAIINDMLSTSLNQSDFLLKPNRALFIKKYLFKRIELLKLAVA